MVTNVTPYCKIGSLDIASIVFNGGISPSVGGVVIEEIQVPGRGYADVRNKGRKPKKYKIRARSLDREEIEAFLEAINTAPIDSEFYPFDAQRFGLIASSHAGLVSVEVVENGINYYVAEAEITCREPWLYGPDNGILSVANARNYTIQATGGGGSVLNAEGVNREGWETFVEVDAGDGKIAIQCSDGHYISADSGGGGSIFADRDEVVMWEKFTKVSLGGTSVAFLCFDGTHYIQATHGGGSTVTAAGSAIGLYETFNRIPVTGGYVYGCYAIYDYQATFQNGGHARSRVRQLEASGAYNIHGYVHDLACRVYHYSSLHRDREIVLCDIMLANDLFKLNWRGEVEHSWDADLTKSWADVSQDVHSKTSGGAISSGVLTLDNGDYLMIPFYGPLPLSGEPGSACIELAVSGLTGDGATCQVALAADLSDMAAVDHDDLVVGDNIIYIPDIEGEGHIAVGIKAAAAGSVSLTGIKGTVKRYVAPSAIPWAEPGEVCAIAIAKSNSGQLESILATMNDRYYY